MLTTQILWSKPTFISSSLETSSFTYILSITSSPVFASSNTIATPSFLKIGATIFEEPTQILFYPTNSVITSMSISPLASDSLTIISKLNLEISFLCSFILHLFFWLILITWPFNHDCFHLLSLLFLNHNSFHLFTLAFSCKLSSLLLALGHLTPSVCFDFTILKILLGYTLNYVYARYLMLLHMDLLSLSPTFEKLIEQPSFSLSLLFSHLFSTTCILQIYPSCISTSYKLLTILL